MIECYDESTYCYYSMVFGVFLFSIILLTMFMGFICIVVEKVKKVFNHIKSLLTIDKS